MLNYKAADNKALTCGVICEDGLKLAREVEGLKMRKRLVYEASVGHTDHRTSAFTTQLPNYCVTAGSVFGGWGWGLTSKPFFPDKTAVGELSQLFLPFSRCVILRKLQVKELQQLELNKNLHT